jgi:hypothetical protein
MRQSNVFFSFAVILFLANCHVGVEGQRVSFSSKCFEIRTFEKAFNGQCNLIEANVYDTMIKALNYTLSADPKITVDAFLRTAYSPSATDFFRETFKDNTTYIASLDSKMQ